MKPVVDWILLANSSKARIIERRGPNRGLVPLEDLVWTAEPPSAPSDRSGTKHSIAGHGKDSPQGADPARVAESRFAEHLAKELAKHRAQSDYDRLVIAAAPHFLGALRKHLGAPVYVVLLAELDKNLVDSPVADIPAHLVGIFAP